ncbi:hypothetical protein JCM8097_007916 [Rhodosporidiobolus ruineniae]
MAPLHPYRHVNSSDAELGLMDKELSSSSSSASTSSSRPRSNSRLTDKQRRIIWALGGAAVMLFVVYRWTGRVVGERKIEFGPPKREARMGRRAVANASTLLTSAAPATSYLDALRPDLRYLTADSWSGLTGQYLSALSLLYLAHLTQRVAVIPSWRDWDHYGDSMITMDLLFDMDKFREETGALFVNWDDVKPLDRVHAVTKRDQIGCYMGGNPFEGGRSFDEHNLDESIWRVERWNGDLKHSIEAFTLFDFDETERVKRTKAVAKEEGREIPKHMLGSQLLCYSNLWDLNHAGAHAGGAQWYDGFIGQPKVDGNLQEMLSLSARGRHPEWWTIGKYIDFKPEIWDIAISAVKRTFKLDYIPKNLITMHLRRGDFKTWCSSGENCTPTLDAYKEQLEPLLALSPPDTRVLVTTDEQDDVSFLDAVDALGWHRVNHRHLGTSLILEAAYGDAARWADAVVDQAILSLGDHFVGTSGSQVSLVTELRVAAWNGGETRLVQRPS